MRFTLKQLGYFVAAGEANSITVASERIHISQPSVSSAISQLEAEFGVQLFFRHHTRGLSITPAGKRILEAANALLRQAEQLHDLADEINSTVGGPLRIGAFRTFASLLLPELCIHFAERFPKVALEMFEDDEAELVAKVRKAEIDIALTYKQPGVDLNFEQLALLPSYVLLPASHPLSKRTRVKLRDLVDLPFVLLDLPVSREYFMSIFERANVSIKIVARTAYPETVRSFVGAGLGFSLLTARPKSMIASNGKKLKYLRLDDEIPPMKLGMITAKNIRKSRAAMAFEDHCRQHVSTESIPGMTSW